jgi:hypothetical protein
MDSILNTVKMALGVEADYNGFDINILLDINSAIFLLNQLGVGPSNGFVIKGENETWQDLLNDSMELELAKSYVVNNVRLSFDPPSNSFLVEAIRKQIEEQGWRLIVQKESPAHVFESVLVTKKHGILGNLQWAFDYGSNALHGLHNSGVVLGGPINRAYYDGVSPYSSYTNIYSPALDALYDGKEVTAIVRGTVKNASTWTNGILHNLLSIYTWPFGNDLTIGISKSGFLEWTVMTGGFPGIISRQVACSDLGRMTLGMTISQSAGEMRAYKEGIQQGDPISAGIDWSRPLWTNGCYIGAPQWEGWAADCIISFGVVATAQQMLAIHTLLDAGTLRTADLDFIFGVGKYAWWKLDEENI